MRDKPGYQGGSYEAAEGQVLAAENALTIAQLGEQIVKRGVRDEELRIAQAEVSRAQAAVMASELQRTAAEQNVVVARAGAAQAEAQLALAEAGPTDEQLQQAKAQVDQGRAALQAAQSALEKHILRAPFAGTITQVDARVGEYVVPGRPVVNLGDLGTLTVETTDLDEIDVARVQVGAHAKLTLDALPGLTIDGTIASLALQAGAGSGGTTFKAVITFAAQEPALRWGMTAFADIDAE